jgi:hypothetical protein
MRNLSSTVAETPSTCMPSRRVVSKTSTDCMASGFVFIVQPLLGNGFLGTAYGMAGTADVIGEMKEPPEGAAQKRTSAVGPTCASK